MSEQCTKSSNFINRIMKNGKIIEFNDSSKIVLISDVHRGNGGYADSLRQNRNIYRAALGFYYENGYTLIELGDGDELWKNKDCLDIADMSAYALKNGENNIPVQIITCPENIDIKNNGFLGIKVNLEELIEKNFTIKSKVKITYKEHIYEKEQTISPKTITVTGGKSSVERKCNTSSNQTNLC